MYKVKIDGNTIYNAGISSDLAIIDPKLELEVNNAGELEFIMPPTHPFYGSVERLSSVVTVEEDGSTIFEGRVTEEKTDFWKRKSYHCEGALAYLKDTKQPPAEYHNLTVRQYLGILLNIHNSKVTSDKQFELGAVTVTDSNNSLFRYTNWESTLQCINDDLIKSLGGYLRIRYEDGKKYLDYLAAFPNTNSQIIRFGRNLLDYASSYDSSDYCTVLIPQGAELEESPIPALHQRLSIEDVNGGSPYLVNPDAVAEHGWIEKVIEWDSVHTAAILLSKGKKYLEDVQFDSMVLSIKAIDLHKLNPEIESIKLMDEIRAISKPHGMDRIFPVTKVSIPLDSASGTEYTLGTKITHSLTSTTEAANEDILNRIKRAKTPQEILESAQDNASALIKSALNGYVVITDDASELLVMDTPDINTARKVWRWNVNGLGYSSTGYDGEYGLALTMDGAIVADFITTGTLNANLIRTGRIEDAQGYNYWDLTTGDFHLLALQDYATKANAIMDTTPQYAVSTSQTTAPTTGWSTETPQWEEGKYVWFRLKMVNGNNHSVYSAAVCIQGAKGEAGTSVTILGSYTTLADLQSDHPTGDLGDAYMVGNDLYVWNGTQWEDVGQIRGDDGRDAIQYYTYFAYASSSDGSQGFSTDPFTGAAYMGVCVSTSAIQPQTYSTYKWSQAKGDKGVGVTSQVPQYYLSESSVTQTGGMWSENEPQWQSGYYIWSRLKIEWSSGATTYTSPILAKALNSANQTAASAESTAQAAEETAHEAEEAVNILDESLYTEEIFNRLTNNGAVQGITMSNGNLYVNASYINSGILNADLIKSGTINADLIKSGTINADLIKSGSINADLIKSGSINANLIKSGSINANLITSGTLNANLLRTGRIEDATGDNYWDLTTGEFSMVALSNYATVASVNVAQNTANAAQQAVEDLDESLDSEEVFSRLTNDGAVKGITMSNGNLYVNATYINSGYLSANRIQGGTLKLGGSNNTYGKISIYDASGTLKGTIDSGGISAQLGQFNAINIDNIDGDNSASITLNSERLDIEAGTLPVWVHNLHTNQLDVTTLGATNAYITYDNVTNLYSNYIELTGDFVWWTSSAKNNYMFYRKSRSDSATGYTLYTIDSETERLSFKPYGTETGSTWYRPVASYSTNGNRIQYIASHSSSHSVANSIGVCGQFGSTTGWSSKNFAPSSSDIRLKENIKDCEIEALPFIQKIRMRQFDWKRNGVHQDCGFVADELEQLDHNLSIGGGYEEDGTMNEKSVNDFYLLGYMVKAMQEMQAEIDYLKGVVKNGINRRMD